MIFWNKKNKIAPTFSGKRYPESLIMTNKDVKVMQMSN